MSFPSVIIISMDPFAAFKAAQEIPELRDQFEPAILGTSAEHDYREWLRKNDCPEPKATPPEVKPKIPTRISGFNTSLAALIHKSNHDILKHPLPLPIEVSPPTPEIFAKGSVALELHPEQAVVLAVICPGGREKLEEVIACDAAASLQYAREVLKGRFLAGERSLAIHPTLGLEYEHHLKSIGLISS